MKSYSSKIYRGTLTAKYFKQIGGTRQQKRNIPMFLRIPDFLI